jgi:hypothetical protein
MAARALRLNGADMTTPFTDTSDRYVLALYKAGIVEGSFQASGARCFYPANSISRAEMAAIVWRMYNLSN